MKNHKDWSIWKCEKEKKINTVLLILNNRGLEFTNYNSYLNWIKRWK